MLFGASWIIHSLLTLQPDFSLLSYLLVIQRLRQEKEEGHIFEIENVLDRVVNVFKYEEAPDKLLQAALMASAAPSRAIQKFPEPLAR